MKVYKEKIDYQSLNIYYFVIFLSLFLISFVFMNSNTADPQILYFLYFYFGLFGVACAYGILVPAITCKGLLVEKYEDEKDGEKITRLVFNYIKEKDYKFYCIPRQFKCYVYGDVNLEKGKCYPMKVRPSNHELIFVGVDSIED